jgi:8-oxo-dGTP diphosphatase
MGGGARVSGAVISQTGQVVDSVRDRIAEIVEAIEPLDKLERAHRDSTLEWIRSGAPIFRTMKPDIPPMHLVSYFALVDEARGKLLLVDHKLAGLWLPSGGHVEPDEHPRATVERELAEELNLAADFVRPDPLFITATQTAGHGTHTDVSLWYLLRGDSARAIEFDRSEFHGVRWFSFDEIPFERSDPHMRRFIAKLEAALSEQGLHSEHRCRRER